MDLLNSAIATGLTALHAVAAEEATYRRGNRELTVRVTWGRTELQEFTATGAAVAHEMADALIADYAELLATFGVPRKGDEIQQSRIVRKVLPAGDEQVYRYSGNQRQALRIHTKIVEQS